jgi:uncharacterized membrane protein YqiK
MAAYLSIITLIAGSLFALVVMGLILSRLYVKVDAERAFVRTGLGNAKVVMNGGAIVLPVFHSTTPVNLKTIRLSVEKKDEHSLVTGDKLRIDVVVDFFVRVGSTSEAVYKAAQTLGSLTLSPVELSRQVEAKFIDALRAVAAQMTLADLHQMRHQFVAQVQAAVEKDLEKNGLEMESVSLTSLNQTDRKYFNVNNVLDAEGLTALTTVTETNKKRINDVETTNAVAIEQRNLEAAGQRAEIKRQTAEVQLRNDQEIAVITAERQAAIAASESEGRRKAEQSAISANQSIAQAEIEAERSLQESRAQAETSVKLVQQQQAITVAVKSKEEAQAAADANQARAAAVAAEEAVITARETEVAKRQKQVAVIAAEKKAQEESIGVVVAAQADKEAAANRADALRIDAEAQRDAKLASAEGIAAEGLAIAEALAKKNDAMNALSPEVIAQQIKLALIEQLPRIVEQAVRPLEKIESIRIASVGGLNGDGASGSGSLSAKKGGLVDEVVDGALRYQAHRPLVTKLLQEVGLASDLGLSKMVESATEMGGLTAVTTAVSTSGETDAN